MKSEVSVYLLGFEPSEKTTFETFFKLAGGRDTLYKVVAQSDLARVVLVNSGNPAAVQWVNTALVAPQKALFVGPPDTAGIWPTVPKPIRLTTILGLLDVLVLAGKNLSDQNASDQTVQTVETTATVSQNASVVPQPAAAPAKHAQNGALSARELGSVRRGSGKADMSDFDSSIFMGLSKAYNAPVENDQIDNILIVDDDDIALKFMQSRITRYGFHAELAKTGKEALIRISTGNFKFVFLEVILQGIDGYQVCRAIKQNTFSAAKPPVVVMFSSRGASADKIRGGLAGCDAYLKKPLVEAELLKILSKFDEQVERSFRQTKSGRSGVSTLR